MDDSHSESRELTLLSVCVDMISVDCLREMMLDGLIDLFNECMDYNGSFTENFQLSFDQLTFLEKTKRKIEDSLNDGVVFKPLDVSEMTRIRDVIEVLIEKFGVSQEDDAGSAELQNIINLHCNLASQHPEEISTIKSIANQLPLIVNEGNENEESSMDNNPKVTLIRQTNEATVQKILENIRSLYPDRD